MARATETGRAKFCWLIATFCAILCGGCGDGVTNPLNSTEENFSAKLDTGVFSHDLVVTWLGDPAQDKASSAEQAETLRKLGVEPRGVTLDEVHATFTMFLEDGTKPQETRYWTEWKSNEKKKVEFDRPSLSTD